jgi:hypothetical protein
LRQFGWVESIKETCRDQRGVGVMPPNALRRRSAEFLLPFVSGGGGLASQSRQQIACNPSIPL